MEKVKVGLCCLLMDANHYGEMVKPQINQLILSFILSTKAQNGRFEKFPTMTYQMWKKKVYE